ncbi:NAD-dependent epimerase/dehydratase family protein [Larkinella soli]|uniref:NAD-dependent epimerase/dehydratase family protein n=1 Tax=Larkinella soli TaxID=1770527 RepID=UPI000FFB9ECA|nr:NAD-dependent epimerase/dehydratase family protein [Larkinella soli]
MSRKHVFVTGAGGLLGTNLVLELLRQGYMVKALLRNPAGFAGGSHPNLRLVRGNLFEDLRPHLADCRYVVHAAAETGQNVFDYAGYDRTNVAATVQLLRAAHEAGVERFVFVSSANTIGYYSDGIGGTERYPIKPPFTESFYALSKWNAEQEVLKYADRMTVSIVNPTFMLGAYDTRPSSGKIILMGLDKWVIFYPPGGKNFVHVRDAASGIVRCLIHGINKERYLLAGENLTYRDFFRKLTALSGGRRPVLVPIPATALRLLGLLGDAARKLRIRTSLSSTNMKILAVRNYYDNRKSVETLGLTYQSLDKAIGEAVSWFRSDGPVR